MSSTPSTRRRLLGGAAALTTLGALSACSDGRGEPAPSRTASPSSSPQPVQLPGGGRTLFPQRRLVALYGSPGTASLGMLGEQDVDAAVERVRALAEQYRAHCSERVEPAFEIIATVADSVPGPDGDFSRPVPLDVLRHWVRRAGEEDVHVVLDLQPGTTDFLTQAESLEELLRLPHVGLALDPEWRLTPGQRHLEQIGSVRAAEINRVVDWMVGLVSEHDLPQKLLILHQFSPAMIPDREKVRASAPEVAVVVHADGHGTPQLKLDTWDALRRDRPAGMRMAWKNFEDEDTPTWTSQRTMQLDPQPWFVSYQ